MYAIHSVVKVNNFAKKKKTPQQNIDEKDNITWTKISYAILTFS